MKKIAFTIIAVLFTVLLPQAAVQAAEQEKVILTAEQEKAGIEIEIPDEAEGVSTLRLRLHVQIEGGMDSLDPNQPIKFEVNENIQHALLETRYHAEKGYLTIYISNPAKITDRSMFDLGYLVPNTVNNTACTVTVSVPSDGLEYVDGTGQLNEKTDISSSSITLMVNQSAGETEEKPGDTTGEATDGTNNGATGDLELNPGEGTNSGHAANNSHSNGEGSVAAKTGDESRIALFCVIAVVSAAMVIGLLIRRVRKKTA